LKRAELAKLTKLAKVRPSALIILDTFAAMFDGKDVNNVGAGEFRRWLRPLNFIDGQPAVVVTTHPIKRADKNNPVPYGAGAISNECDGNLCMTREAGFVVMLHW
jgi:RecA-family ATPase